MTKQTINIGSAPNDGTGTALRDAMDMINDNFSELYARGGPVAGTKYAEVMAAVKYFQVNQMLSGQLFYISSIKAGTGAGPSYSYEIKIVRTGVLGASPAGVEVMSWTASTAEKTGTELINLANVAEGFTGKIIINWAELTFGTTYTADKWTDTGLYCPIIVSQGGNISDESIYEVTVDETWIDGSYTLYVLDPVAPIDINLSATPVAVMNLVNISASDVNIKVAGSEAVNGVTGGTLVIGAGESCQIRPYDSNFIVTGLFTLTAP